MRENHAVGSDSDHGPSSTDDAQDPASLGPYVTRSQLPDPVKIQVSPQALGDSSSGRTTFARQSIAGPKHETHASRRSASRPGTEISLGSRDRGLPSDNGTHPDSRRERRLSKLQLATLISQADPPGGRSSPALWARPNSRLSSAAMSDHGMRSGAHHPERTRQTVNRSSSTSSSALAPLPKSSFYRHRNTSRSASRARLRDLASTIDQLQTALSALQSRIDKLEQPPTPLPDSLQTRHTLRDWLFSSDPRYRSMIVKQWLRMAGGRFLSTFSHLFILCILMWASRVLGRYGRNVLSIIWKPPARSVRSPK